MLLPTRILRFSGAAPVRESFRQWEMGSMYPKYPAPGKQSGVGGEEADVLDVKKSGLDASMTDKVRKLFRPRVGVDNTYTRYCQKYKVEPDFDVFQTVYDEVKQEETWENIKSKRANNFRLKNPKKRGAGGGKDKSAFNDKANASKENAEVGVAERPGRDRGMMVDKTVPSLMHDLYLSEVYEQKHRTAGEVFLGTSKDSSSTGSSSTSSSNKSNIGDVGDVVAAFNSSLSGTARRAFRDEVLDRGRPVLAHELSDFKTPYMMKRGAQKRLLELVARNDMERRLIDKVLDERRDLIKARVKADLPPEALEPLYAFCGVRDWNFDSRRRLFQQMRNVERMLGDAEGGGFENDGKVRKEHMRLTASVTSSSSSSSDSSSSSSKMNNYRADPRTFVSQSDFNDQIYTGSSKAGKPQQLSVRQTKAMRYPTLQSVCKDLPADPTYRSHVLRCVRVLERQNGWKHEDKVRAINVMKTVYHNLRGSNHWRTLLDRKIPLWMPALRMRKYKVRQGWEKRDKYVQTLGCNYKKKIGQQNRQRGGLIVERRKIM